MEQVKCSVNTICILCVASEVLQIGVILVVVLVQYHFFNLQFGWTSFILLIDSFIAIWTVGAHIFELCVAYIV